MRASAALMFFAIICAGCKGRDSDNYNEEIGNAINASRQYAIDDSVDIESFSVYSAARYGNGRTGRIRVDGINSFDKLDIYQKNLINKLIGKRYWEVCYVGSSLEIAGPTCCYYLEANELNLLAVYRMK